MPRGIRSWLPSASRSGGRTSERPESLYRPSSLEYLKLSILIYLDGKHPSASDIVVNHMTSPVSERHGSKIKKTSE